VLDSIPKSEGSYFSGISYSSRKNSLGITGFIDHENVSVSILSSWSPSEGYGPSQSYQINIEGYESCNSYTVGDLSGMEYSEYTYIIFNCTETSTNKSPTFIAKLSKDHDVVDCLVFRDTNKPIVGSLENPIFMETSILIAVNVTDLQQIVAISGDFQVLYQVS